MGERQYLICDWRNEPHLTVDGQAPVLYTAPIPMKILPASSGEFVGLNLMFLVLTLLLSLCLHATIHAGSLLLSYGNEARLVQGELSQKIQVPDSAGELHVIGYTDEQGSKRQFYQYHRSKRPDIPLGTPRYFAVTDEGIVLKNEVSGYVFMFALSSLLSLVFAVICIGVLINVSTHRIACDVRSKKVQFKLNLLKGGMFVLSIAGLIFAAHRVHADFSLPEGKAQVVSVTGNDSYCYHVKVVSLSTKTEWKADWQFFNDVSPATGQEVNICYPPNSEPVFARTPADKLYSLVLLMIALAYMTFTSRILLKGRVLCHASRCAIA